MKPPASKWLVAPGPFRKNSHRKPIHGRFRHCRAGYIDTGWRAGVLDVDLEVVLQVLTHAGQVVDDVDAERLELRGVAHARRAGAAAGELMAPPQQMISPAVTRSSGPATRPRRARTVLDADGPCALEQDAVDLGPADDLQVRPLHRPGGGRPGPR